MMKKSLILLTALCLMLLAVGCDDKNAVQSSSEPNAVSTIVSAITEVNSAAESIAEVSSEPVSEVSVPEEEEYELMSSYNQYYDIDFDNGKVVRSNSYAEPPIEQKGTYRREKNLIYCDFSGYEVVYRLLGETLINLTEDTCKVSDLASYESRLMYLDLKNIDFSSMKDGGYIFVQGGKEYLYLDGTVYMNFCLGYELKEKLVKVQSETVYCPNPLSEHGQWDDDWAEHNTYRYITYDAFGDMYRDSIADFEKMAAYLLANKDTNLNCMNAYYKVKDRGCLMHFTYNQLMERIGALYYTIGEPEKAKEAFAGIIEPETWLEDKYRREVKLNEFNQILRGPSDNEDRYVIDETGLVLQILDRGKITHFRYDDQGRLILKWDSEHAAAKYVYNSDGTVNVYSFFEDRYSNPLLDEYTYSIPKGENRLGDVISQKERVAERPAWLSEIGGW